MNAIYIALIFSAVLALGEVLSLYSKARIPTYAVIVVVSLVLFQSGLIPVSLIKSSVVTRFGKLVVPILLLHMGTLISLRTLMVQYRAVLITLLGMGISVAAILGIVSVLFGYDQAVAGAGPLSGGLLAYLITSQGLIKAGLTSLVAVSVLIIALQSLIGMPLSALLLKQYARRWLDRDKKQENAEETDDAGVGAPDADSTSRAESLLFPPDLINSHLFLIFIIFAGGSLATFLSQYTGFVNSAIWGLIIGIAGLALRVYPEKALERANSLGITMVALLFLIIASLGGVTLSGIEAAILPAIAVLGLGTFGLVLGGWIAGRYLGWHYSKAIPVALTAMYGFPGNYLVVSEVCRSFEGSQADKDALFDELLAPMLIGGFTSVSIGSILIASYLVGTLG